MAQGSSDDFKRSVDALWVKPAHILLRADALSMQISDCVDLDCAFIGSFAFAILPATPCAPSLGKTRKCGLYEGQLHVWAASDLLYRLFD